MEGQRRILDLCVDAGETLLANGAEIYRVQQTMEITRAATARAAFMYMYLPMGCSPRWRTAVRCRARRCAARRAWR